MILLAVGFALIYCGILPREIAGPAGESHSFAQNFLRSLYLSLGTFATFQTFDLSPQTNWLRLVISIEGLIGISMITASVSWLVLLYPALARTRLFARRVSSLMEAEKRARLTLVQALGAPLLTELAGGILQFRLDVILFPIMLNFYSANEGSTIANVLPDLQRIATEVLSEEASSSRAVAGQWLQVTLEDLSHVLARCVLGMEAVDPPQVFMAFRNRDQ